VNLSLEKTIIFGDVSDDLIKFSEEYNASPIDQNKIDIAITDSLNYYTSIRYITTDQALALADSAQRIIIQPKENWTDLSLLKTTLYLCRNFSWIKPIKNLNFYANLDFTYNKIKEESDSASLYLFGGSLVAGLGLNDTDLRFGVLLSKKRKLKLIDHSRPGTGLRRAFEQLLSCSPKPGDVIILDTVLPSRIRICNKNKIIDLMLHECDKPTVLHHTDEQLFYNHVSYLDAFVKLANSMKTKFVFYSWQHDDNLEDYYLHYSNHQSWCVKTTNLINKKIDILDNQHPGPKTHAQMAELLDLRIQQLYENPFIR
jgi:hypothetical protein